MLFWCLDRHRHQRATELNTAFPNILFAREVVDRQAHTTGRLAHGRDVIDIAAETADELTDPLESESLIVQAIVRGH